VPRIISGLYKGRTIVIPGNLPVRPTTDMAREALFNWFQSRVDWESVRVLDLFCGTGSIGLECISRGAMYADFVDDNPRVIRELEQRLEKWDVKNAACFRRNWKTYLEQRSGPYHLIFCDPPYDKVSAPDIHRTVTANIKLLEQGGYLVIEHSGKEIKELELLEGYLESRKYGAVYFSFFEWS
jgi:16S rRNA (guanine966-N2)-methyltransferase